MKTILLILLGFSFNASAIDLGKIVPSLNPIKIKGAKKSLVEKLNEPVPVQPILSRYVDAKIQVKRIIMVPREGGEYHQSEELVCVKSARVPLFQLPHPESLPEDYYLDAELVRVDCPTSVNGSVGTLEFYTIGIHGVQKIFETNPGYTPFKLFYTFATISARGIRGGGSALNNDYYGGGVSMGTEDPSTRSLLGSINLSSEDEEQICSEKKAKAESLDANCIGKDEFSITISVEDRG